MQLHTIQFKVGTDTYEIECQSRVEGYPRDENGDCAFCHGSILSDGPIIVYMMRTPLAGKCPMCGISNA